MALAEERRTAAARKRGAFGVFEPYDSPFPPIRLWPHLSRPWGEGYIGRGRETKHRVIWWLWRRAPFLSYTTSAQKSTVFISRLLTLWLLSFFYALRGKGKIHVLKKRKEKESTNSSFRR